jgi:FtsP/CotA-like multicopper oxidase with cupredoxin domain
MAVDRRAFLRWTAVSAAGVAAECSQPAALAPPNGKADHTLQIGTGTVELAPDRIVSTSLYNGQFPGPLVRLTEGANAIEPASGSMCAASEINASDRATTPTATSPTM